MPKNIKEEPEYHFFATNIDYRINSESKKILAGTIRLSKPSSAEGQHDFQH